MQSRIAEELKLRYQPVAVIMADEKPEEAQQFAEGKWGCVAAMFTAASKGRVVAFDRKTYGCPGGGVGLGFGNLYENMPGGIEYFLSTGRGEGFREGEAYKKTPEAAQSFVDELPITDIPYHYVVIKPLGKLATDDDPQMVVLYCNPDQLAALVVLANYRRPGGDNVIIPFGAGCHSVCLIPYDESLHEYPRAVVGMIDISARPHVDPDLLTFTVPYRMFQEMEEDVPGSFLEKESWEKVKNRIPGG
ncbi:MAG: DUF169 domain-containing protein [Armatimonadetes bacterium]|nr:DUF169 domain-containing protein [Armatimonadota bacterium]